MACVGNYVPHTLPLSAFGLKHEHISKNVADMYPNSTWAFGCGCDGDWLHSINISSQYFQDLSLSATHLPLTAWWSSNRPKEEDCIDIWYSNQWNWPGLDCTLRPMGDGRMSKIKRANVDFGLKPLKPCKEACDYNALTITVQTTIPSWCYDVFISEKFRI